MAKLKKQIIGKISGALGDIVFREYKGSNIASLRPTNINISYDPSAIFRRARFTMAAKLSKALRQSQEVKISWIFKTPQNLTTHSYMVQTNYQFVSDISVSDKFRFTPEKNFIASLTSFDLRENEINARLRPLTINSGIDNSVERKIKMFSVILLTNPVDPEDMAYTFLTLESEAAPLNFDEELDFTLPMSELDKALLTEDYQTRKSFNVVITLDENNRPVKYSDKLIALL